MGNERDLLELSFASEGFKAWINHRLNGMPQWRFVGWKTGNGLRFNCRVKAGPCNRLPVASGIWHDEASRLQGAVGRRRNEHQANGRARKVFQANGSMPQD